MERKSFIKSISALAGASLVPLVSFAEEDKYKLTIHDEKLEGNKRFVYFDIPKSAEFMYMLDNGKSDTSGPNHYTQIIVPAFDIGIWASSRDFGHKKLTDFSQKEVTKQIYELVDELSNKGYKDIHLFNFEKNSIPADEGGRRKVCSWETIGLVGFKKNLKRALTFG